MRITELNYQIFYWLNRMDSYDEVRSVAVFLFLSEEYEQLSLCELPKLDYLTIWNATPTLQSLLGMIYILKACPFQRKLLASSGKCFNYSNCCSLIP